MGKAPWGEKTKIHYLCKRFNGIEMGIYSPFATRKPRQFDFKARYYDPRKERIRALEEAARLERGEQTDATSELAQVRMRMAFDSARAQRTSSPRRAQGVRTLIIFGVLVLVFYVYLRL